MSHAADNLNLPPFLLSTLLSDSAQSTYRTKLSNNPMFALLVTSVVIGTGTYVLYRYLFSENDDENDDYNHELYPIRPPTHNIHLTTDSFERLGHPLKIMFGSQSGTAEGFAFDMAKEGRTYGFYSKAIDLEDYDIDDLPAEEVVIFLVSTYGEGEPTDNAQEFYNWMISEERSDTELVNLDFAVYGLGNTQYQFFNKMGREFNEYLEKLGGTRVFELGEGNDDTGSIEDQFTEWKQGLWSFLSKKYLNIDIDSSLVSKFESTLNLAKVEEKIDAEWYSTAVHTKLPFNSSNFTHLSNMSDKQLFLPTRHKIWFEHVGICHMIAKKEMRQSTESGNTLHIDFDVSLIEPSLKWKYKTADNLGIVVRNDYKMVAQMCRRLGYDTRDVVQIEGKEVGLAGEHPHYSFPTICTVQNLFLWYLDIHGLISKKIISNLAQFAQVESEKQELMLLAKDGIPSASYTTLLKLLENFPSISLGLVEFIEICKPLHPRMYTISSSNIVDSSVVSISIKLEQEFASDDDSKNDSMNDSKNDDIIFTGVCSSYLKHSKIGDQFQVFIEPSKFRLPAVEIPVIMIGVGAGLAPFIGFIDEGNQLLENGRYSMDSIGDWWLFFGCRNKTKDYIYQELLESSMSVNGGCIKELQLAFSRDQKEKVYVQHLIEKNSEVMWKLISDQRARIYVCGGVQMGKAVRETFARIFTFYCSDKNGQKYLDDMLHKDEYVQELWG